MNYASVKYNAVEDGIGIRTALFVSGCRNHCPGCFQKQTWDFSYGKPFDRQIQKEIIQSLRDCYVHGLTLLGGEPFEPENQEALLPFLQEIRTEMPEKSIWAYSGYTFELLTDKTSRVHTEHTIPMLRCIDILVDGRYEEKQASVMLPYRGSKNQRVLKLPESLKTGTPVLSPYGERHGRSANLPS